MARRVAYFPRFPRPVRWALVVVTLVLGSVAFPQGVRAQSAPAFASDDFDRAELGAPWTVVDPLGDGTVAMEGAGTGDARLLLTVPGGAAHEPWNVDNALRAMRPASDTNFTAVARFESVPTARYQIQGILVQQDADDWIRFEVHHNGSGLRAYVGSTTAGATASKVNVRGYAGTSSYVRVERNGSTWTLATSADGQAWTTAGSFSRALQVSSVGVMAANAGSPAPAYTAAVDYLFEASAPVDPEDGGAPAGQYTLTTSASGPGSVARSPDKPLYAPGEAVTLTAVPDAGATFAGWSGGATGGGNPVVVTMGADTSVTATFTPPTGPAPAFASDDFDRAALGAPWTVVDPRGDGTVALAGAGTADARLHLGVPGGVSHDPWHTNNALRALRPAGDVDFAAELKFDSAPTSRYQQQGFLVQQDAGNWIRFNVHHNGSGLRAYAATTVAGASTKRIDVGAATGPNLWLRVERTGDQWVLRTSTNGTTWSTAGSFAHPLDVTAVGPYAGNAGSPAPAFEALVDYVFEASAPDVPEDTPVADTTPPVVTGVTVTPASTSAVVTWHTDEPATSDVAVGTNPSYTLGSFGSSTLTRDHSVTVTGLTPGTTYHYRVSSTNAAGLTTSQPDATFATPAGSGPVINSWYGPRQVVGANGQPQAAYNLLGNVSDPDGVAALSYTLNGGAARNLTLGPNTRRLQAPGDFNADIAYTALQPGENQVVLTARDGLSNVTTATIVLDRQAGAAPLPYTADWSAAAAIGDRGQVVDGRWGLDGDTVRPTELGYDRLLMFGDITWSDYEVTVPVTPHNLGPGHQSPNSGSALVGLALNWRGHTQAGNEQPPFFWYPTGALAWYRWFDTTPKFELRGNGDSPVVRHNRFTLAFGQTYMFKARSETVSGGVRYSWKVWPQGQAEPAAWDLTLVEDAGPATGSVGLIAHHVNVQFGDVNVVPLAP